MIRLLVDSRQSYGIRMAMASQCLIMLGIRLSSHCLIGISLHYSSMSMPFRQGLMTGRGLATVRIWLSKTGRIRTTTVTRIYAHHIHTRDTFTRTANHIRCFQVMIRRIDSL